MYANTTAVIHDITTATCNCTEFLGSKTVNNNPHLTTKLTMVVKTHTIK